MAFRETLPAHHCQDERQYFKNNVHDCIAKMFGHWDWRNAKVTCAGWDWDCATRICGRSDITPQRKRELRWRDLRYLRDWLDFSHSIPVWVRRRRLPEPCSQHWPNKTSQVDNYCFHQSPLQIAVFHRQLSTKKSRQIQPTKSDSMDYN